MVDYHERLGDARRGRGKHDSVRPGAGIFENHDVHFDAVTAPRHVCPVIAAIVRDDVSLAVDGWDPNTTSSNNELLRPTHPILVRNPTSPKHHQTLEAAT